MGHKKPKNEMAFDIDGKAKLVVDREKFHIHVMELIKERIDTDELKVHPKSGALMFSLSDCATILDVEAPQLHYYVKNNVVKPDGAYGVGTKKYFDFGALLTFSIIVILKSKLGRTLNPDIISQIQSKLDE